MSLHSRIVGISQFVLYTVLAHAKVYLHVSRNNERQPKATCLKRRRLQLQSIVANPRQLLTCEPTFDPDDLWTMTAVDARRVCIRRHRIEVLRRPVIQSLGTAMHAPDLSVRKAQDKSGGRLQSANLGRTCPQT